MSKWHDYDKYTKFEKPTSIAFLVWAGISMMLIFVPETNIIISWFKNTHALVYLILFCIFIIILGIYTDYPVNVYVFSNRNERKRLRKNLGIDDTLPEEVQEKHPLIKKIKWNFFCVCLCCVASFITVGYLMIRGAISS